MAERVEKIIAGAFIADIEDIKRDIKRINIQMKSFADNMETLKRRMDSFDEDALMFEVLGEEHSKLKKTVLNMNKAMNKLVDIYEMDENVDNR